MNCWHCDRPAHGVCRFCGRAVCKEHTRTMPYILDIFGKETGPPQALVVADAVWCGVCRPKEDPVELPELA
ncbi:MAG: hypothetical protein P8189_26615 [Anaerolineae bacterium]|jgi:hypothetical protein